MFKVGSKVLLRKITMIFTGEVVEINSVFLRLKNAAWIADTGRYADAVVSGNFNEVEPYPDYLIITVPLGDLVEGFEVNWPLPRKQK